jgi:hypothetical protein
MRLDISSESRRHVITLVHQILAYTVGLRSHVPEGDLCGVPSPSQGPYVTYRRPYERDLGIGTINQSNFSLPALLISLLGAVILLAIVNLVRRGTVR